MNGILSRLTARLRIDLSPVAGWWGLRSWLLHHTRLGPVIGAVLAILAGALFCNQFLGRSLLQASYGLPFLFRQPARPNDLVLLFMDEDSREELGVSWDQPWDRNLHAQLLNRLKAAGARTVVFDVVFTPKARVSGGLTNSTPDQATARLAEAMRAHGRVVIASHLRKEGREGIAEGISVEAPDEGLVRAAAGVGVAEAIEDSDTVVRHMLLSFPAIGSTTLPALALQAARVEGWAPAPERLPRPGEWWLNYYGPPGTIESDSYYRGLRELPPGYFSNKVVVIGEHYPVNVSGARVDSFRSPFRSGPARFPGAEIHATMLQNLLRNEWLRRLPALAEFAFVVFVGAIAGMWLPRLPPLKATAACLALVAGLTLLACEAQWRARIWLPWLIPVLVQLPAALLWAFLWYALKAYMETQFLGRSLSLYLSPKTVEALLRRPELLEPGGQRQSISILATDISNFSKIANRMDAEDLLNLLNQYYEEAIGSVHATDGTVVTLVGDAILAVWNAPQNQPDHQDRAARTALLLHASVVRFNQRTKTLPLVTRLGLHAGETCVGNLGSSSHFNYTVVGQAVNLAARLESFNKQLGTDILASRDFLKGTTQPLATRMIGHFRFKGFDGVYEVHEILGGAELAQQTQPWRDAFARAVHHFHRRAFLEAEAALRETLALRPEDGPSQFLLARIAELHGAQLTRDWAGEIDLDQK